MESYEGILKRIIAKEQAVSEKYVHNLIELVEEGNTIPFIARYRKELTGENEVQDSFDLLLEVMMSYGLVYREHQILKHKQQE